MRNAPDIKTSQAPAPAAPAVRAAMRRPAISKPKAGDSYSRPVNGREVTFTLRIVPADQVADRVTVWKNNERLQDHLTERSLADILPSLRADGQEVPAYGREDASGQIEAADGSRRRMGAILAPCDYLIWVADLTDADMDHFTQVGNQYLPPSAYERGTRFKRLLSDGTYASLREMEAGENVSRKVMQRCIATAELPPEILRHFPLLNDLSARGGEALAKARTPAMIDYAQSLSGPQDPEQLVTKLIAASKPAPAPRAPQWKPDHWAIIERPGEGTQIELSEEIPPKLREKIARWVEKQLRMEA